MNCIFQLPHRIGHAHGDDGVLHVSVSAHTDGLGHSLITGTLGVKEVERRLRAAIQSTCDDITRDIETGIKKGALIE